MRYEVTTALTPQEVFERASAHFGHQGFGLDMTSRDERCLMFEGGGGYVAITSQTGEKTTVELETREWDYAVQQFMKQLPY
jgi:hypothetical protein